MQFDISAKPDFTMVEVDLGPDESILAEAGAMVGMSPNVEVKTQARGGIGKALKRAVLGGESLFINTYTSQGGPGKLMLAPATPGDALHRNLSGGSFMMQSGAFMASSTGIELDTKWGGAKTFFGGEGFFMLKASGTGDLFFSSFGAIHEVEVDGSYIVDTGHIVAFEDTLQFNVRKVGGLKSLFLSGEGLVCDFQGKGTVYLQTRNPGAFAGWIHPFRRVKESDNS